ncbi:hypothetical protein BC938DRAFT_475578 [Jimgerdemannia flammicorona]|uniref:Cora-domain-containing protein n=1 Tax=Jimgerdemannia flammicorona TaxID=994334 RepID=A0A433QRG6_9FUNG|nr:hypothetical protein BC938DRAFT_475578 [Jimgerdemannia flammicorona]
MSTNTRRQPNRSSSSRTARYQGLTIQITRDNSPDPEFCSSPHPLDDVDETIPNLELRRGSKAKEDVCFPLIHADETGNQREGDVNFDVLNKYAEREFGYADSDDSDAEQVGDPEKTVAVRRKQSFYGDYTKSLIDETTERFTFYSVATGTIRARTLNEITFEGRPLSDLLREGVYWIDVLAPTDAEMRMMSKVCAAVCQNVIDEVLVFRIHPLTAEDIQMQETREKCEIFGSYMFVCFRSFDQDQESSEYMRPLSFYNIVLKNGILTFHFKRAPHPHKVRKRLQQLKDFITVTPDWINYAVIDDITDSFAPHIQQIELEADSIDDLVLLLKESEQSDMLRRIGHCRKKVMLLLRLLSTKADVVRGLMKRFEDRVKETAAEVAGGMAGGGVGAMINKGMHHNIALYLGDIQDHIITMVQNLNGYDKILARSHSSYLAQVSVELTQTSAVTNNAIGRLSVFATIVAPMTLVAGLGGMNVKVPGRDQNDLVWFFWIVASMVLWGIVAFAMAKRHGLM